MPYREKTAWMYLLTMLAAFTPYFVWTALNPPTEALPDLSRMGIYAVTSLGWAALLGIGHLLLRRSAPDEAKEPMDERDTAIAHRARTYSYGVLITGMILVGGIMPFTDTGWKIANSAIFMIVLAEMVFHIGVVWMYRRQAA